MHKDRVAKQHDFFKLLLEQNESPCHFALKSRRHELIYLRQVCKQILPLLLPEHVYNCKSDIFIKRRVLHEFLIYFINTKKDLTRINSGNIFVECFIEWTRLIS